MPFTQKGDKTKEWKFDTGEVANWREEQAVAVALGNIGNVEIEESRRRKLAAEAVLLEMEVAKKRSEVIPRDEVERGLSYIPHYQATIEIDP